MQLKKYLAILVHKNSSKIRQEKQSIRTKLLKKRESISKKEQKEKSQKICELLKNSSIFQKAKKIMFFVPTKNEVDIFPVIKESLEGKEVFLPCLTAKEGIMTVRKITKINQLKKNTFNIYEPCNQQCELADPKNFDLIIVPAVGMDKKGNRIGFGKGYYDQFLPKTTAKTIAVIFSYQLIDKIPTEKHDIAIKTVLTEDRLHHF